MAYQSLQPKPVKLKSLGNLKAPSLGSISSLFGFNQPKAAPVQSSSPSSVSTTPTVIKPPVTAPVTTSSPAKQQFISSLSTAPKTTTPTPTPPAPAPAPADTPDTSYLDSYRDYLSQYATTLQPSSEVTAARVKLADVQNKGEERSLKARREYEASLDAPGMLKSGAEQGAAVGRRRNESELADIALEESAASRSLSALTGDREATTNAAKTAMELNKPLQIGDNYYDPKTGKLIPSSKAAEDFTLSEGQSRYKINPKTGQYEKIASVGKTYAPGSGGSGAGGTSGPYVPGANPVVDSWATRIQEGSAKITDIPASQAGLRNAVTVALGAMGNNPEGRPTTTELGKTALVTAQDLLTKLTERKGSSVVGGSRIFGGALAGITPGSDAYNFKNDFNALKSLLSLEGVKYLKGQGAVSDAERALLSQAVTKLNLGQGEAEFKKTLENVINKLESGTISGTETPADAGQVLTSPDGTQEVTVADLTPEELAEAKANGWQ